MAFSSVLFNLPAGGSLAPAGEPQPQFVTLEPTNGEDFFDELEELFASDPLPAPTQERSRQTSFEGREDELERLFRRRGHPALGEYALDDSDVTTTKAAATLPRASPFVGFRRHAPASPALSFNPSPEPLTLPPLEDEEASSGFARLPEEALARVLSFFVELRDVGRVAASHRHCLETLRSPATWSGRTVRIEPQMLSGFAPHLRSWLPAWSEITRLVVPKSKQLMDQLATHAPDLPVDIAWRFDTVLKGSGVEVSNLGRTARRVGAEELVVLADAPLSRFGARAPYFEVSLDDRSEDLGDGLNDFGIGVTACKPHEIDQLGDVADELPRSWVVDFTKRSTCLCIRNVQMCRTDDLTAQDLKEGDRVGIRIQPNALEIFINGVARHRFEPSVDECFEHGSELFPVLDMYGQAVQISQSRAEEPSL